MQPLQREASQPSTTGSDEAGVFTEYNIDVN